MALSTRLTDTGLGVRAELDDHDTQLAQIANISDRVENVKSQLCSVDPDEAYLDLFAARRINITTIYPGIAQVETATAAGTVTANPGGNATITVTSAGMTGSPLTISVALLLDDDANAIADKIRTALGLNAAITAKFTVSGATDKIILTAIAPADDDLTLNIAIAAGTATGITAVPFSAATILGCLHTVIHPSIKYFQSGWNEYKFWMAYTPYDGSSSLYENPCIAVSNDNLTWITPVGLTNPIEAVPGVGYNADPCIFMSPDEKTMNLVWKYSGGSTSITYLRTSTDGTTWTNKVAVLTVGVGVEEVSPIILWDGQQYRLWTVKVADTPNTMYMRTSSDLLTWSAAVACTHNGLSTGELFHMDIHMVGNQYHALMANHLNTSIYFGVSDNGIAWTFGSLPLGLDTGFYYKSGMVPMISNNGVGYGVYVGRFGPTSIWYAPLAFDKSIRGLRRNNIGGQNILLAKNLIPPWIFCDTFDRADDATGLGTSDTGQLWADVESDPMGISSHKAYPTVNGAWSTSLVDLGVANFFAEVELSLINTNISGYLVFRFLNLANYWVFGSFVGGFYLNKKVDGVQTEFVLPRIAKPLSGDRLGVECNGNNIKLYVNNQIIYSLTDASNATQTKIGIRSFNGTSGFDNIVAKTV